VTSSPLVPSPSDILAAVSAGWLVAGRTVLSWLEEHQTLLAVRVQELYDTRLFKLPWNTALAGREPAPEDVAAAAARIRDDSRYRDWYSIDLGDTPWPGDVLLCQRMIMIWSRRDHRAYGTTILITGIAWFTLGLTVALARDLSLADYLIKIFLPSSPSPGLTISTSTLCIVLANGDRLLERVGEGIRERRARQPQTPATVTHSQLHERTYSEIVWLGAGWTAPTRTNTNRTTGLPNSYARPCRRRAQEPDQEGCYSRTGLSPQYP